MKYYVYRIIAGDKIYVGSTKDFENRWATHKHTSQRNTDKMYDIPLYKYMRLIGVDKCECEIIKELYASTKTEAEIEEQSELDKIPEELCLNARKAHLTREESLENARLASIERYSTKRDEYLQKQKEYYTNNKETINEKRRNDPKIKAKRRTDEHHEKQKGYSADFRKRLKESNPEEYKRRQEASNNQRREKRANEKKAQGKTT